MVRTVCELRPAAVFEIGSGAGVVGSAIASQGIRYAGIEPDPTSLATCRREHPDLNVVPASCYDEPYSLGLGKFDLVLSNDVIEHVYEPRRFVTFARAHLNAGGKFVCCTPDYGNYWRNLLLSLFNKWDHHHAVLWDGGHIKFFSKSTLSTVLSEGGFGDFKWRTIHDTHGLPMSICCVATAI